MKACRLILVPVVALALAACAGDDAIVVPSFSTFFDYNCPEDTDKQLEGVDWSRARTVGISIRQDEYDPMIIGLRQNRPYIFRLENRDDYAHTFMAGEFFRSVFTAKVTKGDQEFQVACLEGVRIEAMQTVEIQLLAARDGRYEFTDNTLPMFSPVSNPGGISGVISVEKPRRKMPSPVVRIPEEPPQPVGPGTVPPVESSPVIPVEPSPFDAVEPSPFDAVEPVPAEPSPFDAVEPTPAEPSPFDAVEPAPTEPSPFEPTEPKPAEPAPFEPTEPSPFEPTEPTEPAPFEPTEPAEPAPFKPIEPAEPAPFEPEDSAREEYREPQMFEPDEPIAPKPPEPAPEPEPKESIKSKFDALIDSLLDSVFKD